MPHDPKRRPGPIPIESARLERALSALRELSLPPQVARRALAALLSESERQNGRGGLHIVLGILFALAPELPWPALAQVAI